MAYADHGPGEEKRQSSSVPLHQCGMARAADLIGDRWTLLIIREALYGVTRFDAMQAELGAPRTVLSSRLKKLCVAGVMTRRPYKEPGQRRRHQYVLTSKG
ncbi:MAG: winged helix-turn-helix transcriptional regulator, partial [Hyphococcus sp.]